MNNEVFMVPYPESTRVPLGWLNLAFQDGKKFSVFKAAASMESMVSSLSKKLVKEGLWSYLSLNHSYS